MKANCGSNHDSGNSVCEARKQKTKTQERKSFKSAACFGGVAHLKAMVSLPGSGRDGRNRREPRASLHPRLAPSEAGVVHDVPRHRSWFCTAGGVE